MAGGVCLQRLNSEIEDLRAKCGFAALRTLEPKDVYHSNHLCERGTIQQYDDAPYGEFGPALLPVTPEQSSRQTEMDQPPIGIRQLLRPSSTESSGFRAHR